MNQQLLQPGVSYRTFSRQFDDDDHTHQCPDCGHTANELFVAAVSQDDANHEFVGQRGQCADCYVRETIGDSTVIVPLRPEGKTLMEVFTGTKPPHVELRDHVQKLLDEWAKAELLVISEFSGDTWTDTEKLHNRASEFVAKWNVLHKPERYVGVPASLIERMAEVRSMQASIQ